MTVSPTAAGGAANRPARRHIRRCRRRRRRAAPPSQQPHAFMQPGQRAHFGVFRCGYTRRAKTRLLACVSTAPRGDDTAFALRFHYFPRLRHCFLRLRHCLCLAFPLLSATKTLLPPTKTLPLPCVSAEDRRCLQSAELSCESTRAASSTATSRAGAQPKR